MGNSTIPPLPKSAFTAWFMSDLVGNSEDGFSHNEAHLFSGCSEDNDCTDTNCLQCDTRSGNCVGQFTLRERLCTHEIFIEDQEKIYFYIISRSSP